MPTLVGGLVLRACDLCVAYCTLGSRQFLAAIATRGLGRLTVYAAVQPECAPATGGLETTNINAASCSAHLRRPANSALIQLVFALVKLAGVVRSG